MVAPEAQDALVDLFRRIDKTVAGDVDRETRSASECFEAIGDAERPVITPVETAEVDYWSAETIRTSVPAWELVYGIDGSTTQPLQYSNGLLIGAASSTVGSRGTIPESESSAIRDANTIGAVLYHRTNDTPLPRIDHDGAHIEMDLFRFPSIESRVRQLPNWVSRIARMHSESRHLQRVGSETKHPILVDGPVFPTAPFNWYEQSNEWGVLTPLDAWSDRITTVMQQYVKGVEQRIEMDAPLIGIVKSPRSKELVETVASVPGLTGGTGRWHNDNGFMSEALAPGAPEKATLGATSWLEPREDVQAGRKQPNDPGVFDSVELAYDESQYKRAFFYARLPGRATIIRVETPKAFLQSAAERRAIRSRVLRELAFEEPGNVPIAITRADQRANISRALREQLDLQNAERVQTYEQLRGYTLTPSDGG